MMEVLSEEQCQDCHFNSYFQIVHYLFICIFHLHIIDFSLSKQLTVWENGGKGK